MTRFIPEIAPLLPQRLAAPLFGDRRKWGLVPDRQDSDWLEWERRMPEIYAATQLGTLGRMVNHSGYRFLRHFPLDGKRVVEIGPGRISHMPYWSGKPEHYTIVDRRSEFIDSNLDFLRGHGIAASGVLAGEDGAAGLPLPDQSADLVISFYALEHLHPIDPHLAEIKRVLAPGGLLVGAIPAEGGLGWGLGRLVSSRRWMKANTGIDPDKLICWEHPNFASDVLGALERHFRHERLMFWPLAVPVVDLNLVVAFAYRNG